ncbi:hypothetical protein DYY67_1558 [Candidatus Nitrosotalea sp. TS]|nr:hypothetical protein [Candidatus Nitrosotalea sp. TS]
MLACDDNRSSETSFSSTSSRFTLTSAETNFAIIKDAQSYEIK